MTGFVERVARAVIEAENPKRDFFLNPHYAEEMRDAVIVARAAISAMREFPEALVPKQLADEMHEAGYVYPAQTAASIFGEMIDAALEEEK